MSDLCREWEEAAQGAALHGVRVSLMRIGLVLGRQGALPMLLLPVRLGLGGPIGGGEQWISWIHVDDMVRGIAHLCQAGDAGAYNFTAPGSVTQAQFSRIAAGVMRRPWGFPTPGFPIRWALGEQVTLLLDGQRVSSKKLRADGFVFLYPQIDAALRSLA